MFLFNNAVCDIGKEMIGGDGLRTSTITPPSPFPTTLDIRSSGLRTMSRISRKSRLGGGSWQLSQGLCSSMTGALCQRLEETSEVLAGHWAMKEVIGSSRLGLSNMTQ
jgi:hypothetical protein